jgi:transcriptional regulator with XRE-family HTH domain
VERIKWVREARGLSLADLAKLTGLHRTAIARLERKGYDPKASTVALIAKALDLPVCELFEESGHEREGRKPKTKR